MVRISTVKTKPLELFTHQLGRFDPKLGRLDIFKPQHYIGSEERPSKLRTASSTSYFNNSEASVV